MRESTDANDLPRLTRPFGRVQGQLLLAFDRAGRSCLDGFCHRGAWQGRDANSTRDEAAQVFQRLKREPAGWRRERFLAVKLGLEGELDLEVIAAHLGRARSSVQAAELDRDRYSFRVKLSARSLIAWLSYHFTAGQLLDLC